jgi:tetratricopeptide (TPR) repeat protein
VLALAVTVIARLPELGHVDIEKVALLREALSALPEEDARRPYLSALIAKSLLAPRDPQDRISLALQAVADAKRLSDPLLQADTLHQCQLALAEPTHLGTREDIAADLSRLGQHHPDHRILWHAATAHVQNAVERGDFVGVDRAIATIETLAADAREPLYRWYLALFRAMRRYVAGDIRDAEAFALKALHLGACVGESTARQAYIRQVAGWLRIMNRGAECEVLVREMTHRYPTSPGWRLQLAAVQADRGQRDLAKQMLSQILEDPQLANDPYRLAVLCTEAELCSHFGTAELARSLHTLIEPFSDLWGSNGFGFNTFGPVQRYLGMLAIRMGELDAAEFHLARALASSEAAGSGTFTSLTCITYAKAFLKRGDARAARRAGELLNRSDLLNVRHGFDALSLGVRAMAERAGIRLIS